MRPETGMEQAVHEFVERLHSEEQIRAKALSRLEYALRLGKTSSDPSMIYEGAMKDVLRTLRRARLEDKEKEAD